MVGPSSARNYRCSAGISLLVPTLLPNPPHRILHRNLPTPDERRRVPQEHGGRLDRDSVLQQVRCHRMTVPVWMRPSTPASLNTFPGRARHLFMAVWSVDPPDQKKYSPFASSASSEAVTSLGTGTQTSTFVFSVRTKIRSPFTFSFVSCTASPIRTPEYRRTRMNARTRFAVHLCSAVPMRPQLSSTRSHAARIFSISSSVKGIVGGDCVTDSFTAFAGFRSIHSESRGARARPRRSGRRRPFAPSTPRRDRAAGASRGGSRA